mmetsp:Transcript_10293/g.38236  ORF Transcript_10293/g.38236 Transcript_10293/m.38236 type:complete len:105 (+) Transcript_10293:634-948(+)
MDSGDHCEFIRTTRDSLNFASHSSLSIMNSFSPNLIFRHLILSLPRFSPNLVRGPGSHLNTGSQSLPQHKRLIIWCSMLRTQLTYFTLIHECESQRLEQLACLF